MNPSEAYDIWRKAPTNDNMFVLLNTLNPLISKALVSYAGGDSAVLRGQAKSLALKAIKSYDPKFDVKLETYLYYQLQPLRRASTKQNPFFIPERAFAELKIIQEAEHKFMDKYGREPDNDELSDLIKISPKKIEKIKSFANPTVTGSAQEDLGIISESQKATDMDSHKRKTWEDYIYYDLEPIKKNIMDYKFGRYGKPKLNTTQIATRLKLSPGRVSQLSAEISEKLNEYDQYGDYL